MKRLFLILFAVLGSAWGLSAQTHKYYSTEFAYMSQDEAGNWSDWSDWEPSRCLITISMDRDVINIYSETPQEFDVYEYVGEQTDDEGGTSVEFKCVDADGLRCHIRLRRQEDDVLQLYVDYSNLMYVYCLEERN